MGDTTLKYGLGLQAGWNKHGFVMCQLLHDYSCWHVEDLDKGAFDKIVADRWPEDSLNKMN